MFSCFCDKPSLIAGLYFGCFESHGEQQASFAGKLPPPSIFVFVFVFKEHDGNETFAGVLMVACWCLCFSVRSNGSNTSGVYRFKLQENRYVFVQTKSKLFKHPKTGQPEFTMSTHSIVRSAGMNWCKGGGRESMTCCS